MNIKKSVKNIAIFASGTGSNAKKIIEHVQENDNIHIRLVVSNKRTAGVLSIAANHEIPTLLLERDTFYNTENYLSILAEYQIDFIVLAGFLWLIPAYLVTHYPQKIVNIHPALLPKYGGKGMYGNYVHQAVYEAKESKTGITIHFVNEEYDEGAIIFQSECPIEATDAPTDIAQKVQQLEHRYFPIILENLLNKI